MGNPVNLTLLVKILVTVIGLVVGTFVLVAKSSFSRANKYLAFIIFIISWFQIQPVIYHEGLLAGFPWLYGVELIALYAMPPLMWLYFYFNRNSNEELSWKQSLVFLPAVLYFLAWVRFAFMPSDHQTEIINKVIVTSDYGLTVSLFGFDLKIVFGIFVAWMSTFLILIGRELILLYRIDEKGKWDVEHLRMMKKWLTGMFFLIFLVALSFFYNFYKQAIDGQRFVPHIGFTIFRIFLLSSFMIRIVFYPEILFGIPQAKFIMNQQYSNTMNKKTTGNLVEGNSNDVRVEGKDVSGILETEKKETQSLANNLIPQHSDDELVESDKTELGLPIELVSGYLDKIDQLVFDTKPFTDPEFTFEKLSKITGIPKSHLSYILRYHYEETFVEFRTRLRIQLAQELILDPSNKNLTLEAIGEMVGFPSRFTFIRAFKKITNHTPGEFLDSTRN